MRWVLQLAGSLLAAVLAVWLAMQAGAQLAEQLRDRPVAAQLPLAQAQPAIAYPLPRGAWLEYALPVPGAAVRLVSNAVLAPQSLGDHESAWDYAIEYVLLDAGGRVLATRTYHHRAGVAVYDDEQRPTRNARTFFAAPDAVAADARSALVPAAMTQPAGASAASRLRVRLLRADAAVREVVLRAYQPEPVPAWRQAAVWQRMSPQDREALARGNVYGAGLLTEAERAALVRNGERPLGPAGVAGVDYQSRRLYVLPQADLPAPPRQAGPGLRVERDLRGIVPLPSQGGSLHLEMLAGADPPPSGAPVQLTWHSAEAGRQQQHRLTWTGGRLVFDAVLNGGLLEIAAPGALLVRAWLTHDGQVREITPAATHVRSVLADPDGPAPVFAVHHQDGLPTPMRIDLRQLAPDVGGAQAPASVSCELLDGQGHAQQTVRLLLTDFAVQDKRLLGPDERRQARARSPGVSLYDRAVEALLPAVADGDADGVTDSISDGPPAGAATAGGSAPTAAPREAPVSDPGSHYLLLPPDVAAVRCRGSRPGLLVHAATRPARLARTQRIPEDQFDSELEGWREPAWFAVQPLGLPQLRLAGRSVLLSVQPRPPRLDPLLAEGRYTWEDYRPAGRWLASQLFAPADPALPLRPEALASLYRPLPAGAAVQLHFAGTGVERSLQPRLACVRPQAAAATLEVDVAGRPTQYLRMAARRAELALAALPVGEHRVRLAAGAGTRCWISHAGLAAGALQKRLAHRLESGGELTFDYPRTTDREEALLLRWHARAGAQDNAGPGAPPPRTQLVAHVAMPTTTVGGAAVPLEGWTFGERVFDIAPRPEAALLMDDDTQAVDAGRSFSIVLAEGSPPGRYRIRLRVAGGPGGYLTLARVTPGTAEQRKVQIANDDEDRFLQVGE